jgi:hypothetical protein
MRKQKVIDNNRFGHGAVTNPTFSSLNEPELTSVELKLSSRAFQNNQSSLAIKPTSSQITTTII